MDRTNYFFLGVAGGLVIGLFILLATEEQQRPMIERNARITEMVKQCEATLPRNETCELVAVPARKKEAYD